MKKPSTGYKKTKKVKKKKNHYIGRLLVANPKKVSANEKIVKFLIYIALRLVIRPRRWKDPKKNYEIIDRTHKRIMSADFIFIPSSIAFYLIMAFMPILSLITFLYQIPAIQSILTEGHFEGANFVHHGAAHNVIATVSNKDSRDFLQHVKMNSLPPNEYWSLDLSQATYKVDVNLVSNVLGRFIPGMEDILNSMATATNGGGKHIIHTGAFIATVLSLIVSTWIAAGGFAKLVFTQSYMYEHKFVGGYWMNKIKGMFMVAIFTMSLIVALIINITVTKQIDGATMSDGIKSFLKILFLVGGLFVGIFLAFLSLFKLSPRYSIKVKNIIPGTMVATIPTAGFLILFGLISTLWSYGNYGIIGTIMFVGMSALIITYFIFVGISANVSYYRTFVGDKLKNKWTISKK